MPKMLIQDQLLDVPNLEFLNLVRNWVEGCENFGISCISNHSAGLVDFDGKYFHNTSEHIHRSASVIKKEIEDLTCLELLNKFLNILDIIFLYEQEIVSEYAKTVNLDISLESNRKRLRNRVYKYRFGDISKGTNAVVPESVMKIREQSIELLIELKKVANNLDAELERMILAT